MSFAELKKQSKLNFDILQQELEKTNKRGGDDRFWKPTVDETGNGYAVIRFLPPVEGENLPFVKIYRHNFKSPQGQWLIENCPTTNGEQCPICQSNTKLWSTKQDQNIATARDRGRKETYYANIYVVDDPNHPENNGKVFLYRYGKMIHEKLLAAMKPEFKDETPVKVFDLWEGANFKIKIRMKGGYWNYDPSGFDFPAALSADDSELEAIWKQAYPLQPFVARSEFKSYEDLETRFLEVTEGVKSTPARSFDEDEEEDPIPMSSNMGNTARDDDEEEEEDDALSYFASLADED
jgi:hypothetical protein